MSVLAKLDSETPTARAVQPHAAQQWVLVRAVAEAAGVHARTVERQAGAIRSSREHRAANGKAEREALLSSLPAEWQAPVRAAEARQQSMARHLTPKQRAVREERLRMIEPAFAAGDEGRTAIVKRIAAENRYCERHIWELGAMCDWGRNLEALAPKPRKDCGRLRAFEGRVELQKFAIAKWRERGGKNCIAAVRRAVRREWGGPLLPYQGKPPSYRAIRNFIESIPQADRDAATETRRNWETNNGPYLTTLRGKHLAANEEVVGDERILDVLCANERGEAVRLRVTALLDTRTRVARVVVDETANRHTIARCLRDWICEFGLPKGLRFDNGPDYKSVGRGAQHGGYLRLPKRRERSRFAPAEPGKQGLLARLGIEVSYCLPYHPQGKMVESFFAFLANDFDKLFFGQGYTGATPGDRPDLCRELEKQHAEFLAGKCEKSPLPAASYVAALLQQWVKEFNESHEHSGVGMEGRAPMQVLDELLPPAARRIPDLDEPLFLDVAARKVENCKVQLNNATYSASLDDEEGQAAMYHANKQKVAVYFDPSDPRWAQAYENKPNGRALAMLYCDDLAGLATREQVQAITKLRRKLFRASRQMMDALCAGVPSEIELLGKRGGIEPPPPMRSPAKLGAAPRGILSDPLAHCKVSDEDAALLDQVEEASA